LVFQIRLRKLVKRGFLCARAISRSWDRVAPTFMIRGKKMAGYARGSRSDCNFRCTINNWTKFLVKWGKCQSKSLGNLHPSSHSSMRSIKATARQFIFMVTEKYICIQKVLKYICIQKVLHARSDTNVSIFAGPGTFHFQFE